MVADTFLSPVADGHDGNVPAFFVGLVVGVGVRALPTFTSCLSGAVPDATGAAATETVAPRTAATPRAIVRRRRRLAGRVVIRPPVVGTRVSGRRTTVVVGSAPLREVSHGR